MDLGTKRLYFVTGKGGTGKTSVCVGLARALARRGKRVLILEVDAPRPNLPSYFGGKSSYEPIVLAPRIEGANIDFFGALRSYVESVVPMRRVVGMVLESGRADLFDGDAGRAGARPLVQGLGALLRSPLGPHHRRPPGFRTRCRLVSLPHARQQSLRPRAAEA